MTEAKKMIRKLADRFSMSQAQMGNIWKEMLEELTNAITGNGRVTFVGFGTFSVRNRSARKGRNPRTGEEISVPAKKVVTFSPGKVLREKVAKSKGRW